MEKGYIHIYTGNGKGKTTSSIGLALRAVGAGKKVYFGQFMKQGNYSEIKMLKERFPEITVEQFGDRAFVHNYNPTETQKNLAKEGFEKIIDIILKGEYDLIIFDEICVAIFMEIIDLEQFLNILNNRNNNTEIVLTGRYAHKELIDIADLVTEMTEVKHYYKNGVMAREGIEL